MAYLDNAYLETANIDEANISYDIYHHVTSWLCDLELG